ncbi:MAG: serine/threonine-protein kinase [Pseudomonadota bacterium]
MNSPRDRDVADEAQTEGTVLAVEPEPESESESVEIPGYEVIRALGKGGMGMVYLARQLGVLEREVALKTILPKHEDEVFRRYFLREGNRQAKLHHPNILPIFTAGEAGEMLYLSVYYARDGSLRDRMDAKVVDVARAAEIICDVLSALHHAHCELDVPIAHLDVKPENILFDGDNAFLADFGIAKILAEDATVVGVVAGDPRYWPPEQQLNQASTQSDIYATSVMFFEMLTGERPDAGLRAITSSAQTKALAAKMPQEARVFAPLIAQCLNPDPTARPDAGFLVEEIRRLRRPRQISRRILASAAVALLLGVALSQPAVRDGLRDRWLQAFPPPSYAVAFSLTPSTSRLWVDGAEEPLHSFSLTRGEHRIVAVAPGYLGESFVVEVEADQGPLQISLAPMPAANDAEYLAFINSFDGSDQSHAMDWREPTLRNLVALDRLEQSSPEEFKRLIDELDSLAFAGDTVAATSLFYAAFEGIETRDGPKTLMQGLVGASEAGYPVASLLRALYIVQSLLDAQQTFNSNPYAFEEVETLLTQVAAQGLPQTAALVARVAGINSLDSTQTPSP